MGTVRQNAVRASARPTAGDLSNSKCKIKKTTIPSKILIDVRHVEVTQSLLPHEMKILKK